MSRPLFAFALLSLPALAQAGQLTFSPSSVSVDNGNHSSEIVLSYQPSADVDFFGAGFSINLDRLGWADVQVVPSASPYYVTNCQVQQGRIDVAVAPPLGSGLTLPTSAPIPVCRLRVRPHAQTPRAYYWIDLVYSGESAGVLNFPVPANRVRVYVP